MALQKSRDFFVVPCNYVFVRYLNTDLIHTITKDHKMAFLAGPRQVGKTTLAQALLKESLSSNWESGYFNWDIPEARKKILSDPTHFWKPTEHSAPSRIILDEIHKYPRWKRFLKGFFDANREKVEVLVTGSGRLDLYQKGGDSLFGRYHLYHLFPFSVGELIHIPAQDLDPTFCYHHLQYSEIPSGSRDAFESLWQRNGFPEPLFADDSKSLGRWQHNHRQLVLREDLRDLTQIREIGLIESMISLLPERIGSPLSLNALREDLNVNYRTVQNWLATLGRLYFLFAIRPYAQKIARALHREEKVYFFDWSVLEDEGKRFENLMAVHLLKACSYWTDVGYGEFELHYVRDKEKRETDFLMTKNNRPFWLIEVKLAETTISRSLLHFQRQLKPAYTAQVLPEFDT